MVSRVFAPLFVINIVLGAVVNASPLASPEAIALSGLMVINNPNCLFPPQPDSFQKRQCAQTYTVVGGDTCAAIESTTVTAHIASSVSLRNTGLSFYVFRRTQPTLFNHVMSQHVQNVLIDKYNLLSNYAVARDQAFKKSTIISAFRRCGIWPLDESAVPELFEPARNYTTQAAMPLAPRLPALLVPASTDTTRRSSATASRFTDSTSSAASSTPSTSPSNLSRTYYHVVSVGHLLVGEPIPFVNATELLTASRSALAAENDQLRNLLKAAGIELDKNYAQMVLMERENGNMRQQLHAKKNKSKRTYTTGNLKARLMTSAAEMAQAFA
ncbi:hypothetical protein GGX14DRAFT_611378 [Mycena pura]|uniref:Uncharacterized protein n=1 Tax=Mycena pura TaxID=153505 RepID=A0AAD6UJP9_9AGAR|nr:hypothetical protein GGX14DRAFT_611378 [Mycena pura]